MYKYSERPTAKSIIFVYPFCDVSSTSMPAMGDPTRVATAVSMKKAPMRPPILSSGEICATAGGTTLMKTPEVKPYRQTNAITVLTPLP